MLLCENRGRSPPLQGVVAVSAPLPFKRRDEASIYSHQRMKLSTPSVSGTRERSTLFVPPTGQKFRFGDRKVCSDFIDHHNNLRFVRLHAHDFICLAQLAERRTAVNALVRAKQGIEHAHAIDALLRVSALFGADSKQRKVIARKDRVVIIILLSGKLQNCRKIQPESL